MQKPKFELYVERTFSQKLSATFDFLSENGKVIFKLLAYLLLPVSAVQAIGLDVYFNSAMSAAMGGMATDHTEYLDIIFGLMGYLLAIMAGTVLCTALIYSLTDIYGQRQERLAGITMGEVRPTLMGNIGRVLKMMLAMILVITVAIVLSGIIVWMAAGTTGGGANAGMIVTFILVLYIALFIFMLPLSLALPAYLLEKDLGVWEAMRKSLRLGFKTWGGIFAVTLVLGFIGNFIHGVSFMPWYIMQIVKTLLVSSDNAADIVTSPVYTFITYLFGVAQSFGMYISMTIIYTGLAVQYGHAAEKIDGVSVERDVDNFEQMGDDNEDDLALFEK